MATKMEAALHGNDELEQFAYIVSHDLQQQVRNITNFTGLIAKHQGNTDDEDFKLYLRIVTDSATTLNEQLAALLAFSRIGHNHTTQQVDCGSLVRDVLSGMGTLAAKITVGELPLISGDPAEITLIFQSLISNALKFTRENTTPQINIKCCNKTAFWEFSISDNGIGIKEKYFQKIFLIFHRLHAADEYPGLGTGLAFAKKAVEKHQGTIWVDAEPGNGAVFYFTIPII
jgi:light-regulated signal transduction histidine kinase (bacteriophytochrome)